MHGRVSGFTSQWLILGYFEPAERRKGTLCPIMSCNLRGYKHIFDMKDNSYRDKFENAFVFRIIISLQTNLVS